MSGPVTLVAAVLAACAAPDRPILAEVFYDAIGDDAGHEFVELFNPSGRAAPLAGLVLEAGDGAGAGRWTARWTGGAGDTLPPGSRFVVGGAAVVPVPDAIASLDLQNGPDAVRLRWPDGAVEVVGYGALAFAEYACGAPAVDAPSGQSLARVPDASDQGSNALDFRAAPPSPGAANQPARDAAMVPGTLDLEPERSEPGGRLAASGAVANRGAEAWRAGEAALAGIGRDDAGAEEAFTSVLDAALAPGDTARFAVELAAGRAGKRVLVVRVSLPGDQAAGNDADSVRFRVGPGPLELTEVQFHPARGEGEWIEARNRGREPVDPAAFRLGDRGGADGAPADGWGTVAPESLVVLAEDPAALLALHPGLDPDRIWRVRPWASLNNSDDSSGVADVVDLREADGTPCDRLAYAARGVPAGVPLERRGASGWWPATAPLGTPLAPPRSPVAIAGRFEVAPRRLAPGTGPLRLAWSLPWSRGRLAVELYDLAGRRLAIVVEDGPAPGQGEREWDAQTLRPGLYLMVLRARDDAGGQTLTSARPLRVVGGAP
jgi:hypothetical protein